MGDTATLGKTSGTDRVLNKPTYPALLGLEGAREHARMLYEEALASLEPLDGKTDPLRWIAAYIIERAY
jgi:farnesyl diphosphate synthase